MKKLILTLLFISNFTYASQTIISCKNKNMKFSLTETETTHTLSYKVRNRARDLFNEIAQGLTNSPEEFKSVTIKREFTAPGRYVKKDSIESLVWVADDNIIFHTNTNESMFVSSETIPVVHYEIKTDENAFLLSVSYYKNYSINELFKAKNCTSSVID